MSGSVRLTQKRVYYGWVLMVVLGITTIISYGTTQYLFGVLVVPISTSLHWDRASVSGAYAVGLIMAGVLGVPVGPFKTLLTNVLWPHVHPELKAAVEASDSSTACLFLIMKEGLSLTLSVFAC